MEEKEGLMGSGVAVIGDEAPQSFRVEPMVENRANLGDPLPRRRRKRRQQVRHHRRSGSWKKKRGRPRKYAPDGFIVALSPMPISASIPLTGYYFAWNRVLGGRIDYFKKKKKSKFESAGTHFRY